MSFEENRKVTFFAPHLAIQNVREAMEFYQRRPPGFRQTIHPCQFCIVVEKTIWID